MPGSQELPCPVPGGLFFGLDLVDLEPSTLFVNPAVAFDVTANFLIGGLLVPFLQAAPGVAFTFTAYYESFGGGPEGTLGSFVGNTNTTPSAASVGCVGATEYALTINVPATTLAAGSQTYKLTGTLVLSGGFPANAHAEGPIFSTA